MKLISGSLVLEDLTLIRCSIHNYKVLQIRSRTLKRIQIDESTAIEIDASLLQCLRAEVSYRKVFKIISLGFFTKLDIDLFSTQTTYGRSLICDVLTDISRARDLVLRSAIWEVYMSRIFEHLNTIPRKSFQPNFCFVLFLFVFLGYLLVLETGSAASVSSPISFEC